MERHARGLLLLTGAALSTLVLVLLASGSERTDAVATSTSETALDTVKCDRIRLIYADMYFYDDMSGFDCLVGGEEALLFREYSQSASVGQVLEGWAPLLSSGRKAIWGKTWFAVGDPAILERVAGATGIEMRPTAVPSAAKPLQPRAEQVTTCVRFVSGSMIAKTTDSSAYHRDIESLEVLYPGIGELVEDALVPDLVDQLKTLFDSDALEFQAVFSTLGDVVHDFCQSHVGLSHR